jgi:hypothetical protein
MRKKQVSFDCVDAHWAVEGLTRLMNYEQDRGVRIEIDVFGPGGGNPEILVTGMSDSLYELVQGWLKSEHMTWTDDDGEIQDYA